MEMIRNIYKTRAYFDVPSQYILVFLFNSYNYHDFIPVIFNRKIEFTKSNARFA
jgi:hypothetical protein